MQIEPQYTLPLVYELTDPFDTGVYYVRAVIRDSLSGETLQTINLIDKGNGRYTNSISAPQDPTGQGRHIDVVISIYTDAGYTTLSQTYQNKIDKFLIKRSVSFGGAGGVDVDYLKIQKMIDISVQKIIEGTKSQPMSLEPVIGQIKGLEKVITGIKMPTFEQKQQDMSPIISSIEKNSKAILKEIGSIEIPKPKDVDLYPIVSALEKVQSVVDSIFEAVNKLKNGILETIGSSIKSAFKINTDRSQKLKQLISELSAQENQDVSNEIKSPEKPNKEIDNYFPKP